MKLTEIICRETVMDGLQATTKEEVIREMVEHLVAAGKVQAESQRKVVKALMDRERLGSTGVGKGVAVPHAKHDSIQGLLGALGRSKKGISFESLDGESVELVFLLLSSKDQTGRHLEALSHISRLLRDELFCRFLKNAKNAQDLWDLLQESDQKMAGG